MRKPTDCPRERHPVDVSFSVDGVQRYQRTLPPSGIWNDGESSVYQRLPVQSGARTLHIGMRDSGPREGFDYERRITMTLEAGQHVVVEFDQTSQAFVIR